MYGKPDFYSDKAKKMGYPARSVFKLEEIDKKYRICTPGRRILDIGAAPGSWSLYCFKKIGGDGLIVAVDLKEISISSLQRQERVHLLAGDIRDGKIREQIGAFAPFDAIVSDAAPNTSGNRTIDCGRSHSLVANICTIFLPMLRPGGDLVVKLFQGSGEEEVIDLLRSGFSTVKKMRPKACRKNSFETFVIGKNKLNDPSSV